MDFVNTAEVKEFDEEASYDVDSLFRINKSIYKVVPALGGGEFGPCSMCEFLSKDAACSNEGFNCYTDDFVSTIVILIDEEPEESDFSEYI